MSYEDRVPFDLFKGKIFKEIKEHHDKIDFIVDENEAYRMFHDQDCCESVFVEDICGDLENLIDSPILVAEEASNNVNVNTIDPDDQLLHDKKAMWEALASPVDDDLSDDSNTWTFYKLATIKGSVTIRWHGTSNGYYAEGVDVEKIV